MSVQQDGRNEDHSFLQPQRHLMLLSADVGDDKSHRQDFFFLFVCLFGISDGPLELELKCPHPAGDCLILVGAK